MTQKKKLLDNPVLGNFIIPIAIVLIGAFLVFLFQRLLQTEKSYKELLTEMNSRTFGNRWVAAFELSKLIAANKIPEAEIPGFIAGLEGNYKIANGEREKLFIVAAAAGLKRPEAKHLLIRALDDFDQTIQLHALVGIGNLPEVEDLPEAKIISFLNSEDEGIKIAAIFTVAQHQLMSGVKSLQVLLESNNTKVKWAAISALVNFGNEVVLTPMADLLKLKAGSGPGSVDGLKVAKQNLLQTLKRRRWEKGILHIKNILLEMSENEKDLQLVQLVRENLDLIK